MPQQIDHDQAIQFLAGLERAEQRQPAAPSNRLRLMKVGNINAAYDAAQTDEFNERYWRRADQLSADEANSPEVRRILRSRARYECLEGNSFLRGIVDTLALDTIGTGPRLQMQLSSKSRNQQIERSFHRWARQIRLARKLRTMRVGKAVDGEAFAHFTTNRRISHPVKLDLRLTEADQISTPFLSALDPNTVDGVKFDEDGNPIEYHRLKHHPGDPHGFGLDHDPIPAGEMIHLFRQARAGQHRGVPEVATSLPLCILLRDYTLAVLHNAKTVAKHTAILETQAGQTNEDGNAWDPQVEPFDTVDLDYDAITSIPFGWKMNQLNAVQPPTTYKEFRDAILNEIARPVHMPMNVAAVDSSKYNYASGRLDHQTYFRGIQVERSEWEEIALDSVLEHWFDEAVLVGEIPGGIGPLEELPHQWRWDGREHADPNREANAQSTRLASGTTSREREYAMLGLDVDVEDEKAAQSFGLTVEQYRQALAQSTFNIAPNAPTQTDIDEAVEAALEEAGVISA